MPKKIALILIAFVWMAVFALSVKADILHTKSGRTLEGKVIEETADGGVVLEIPGGQVSFSSFEIEHIERKKYNPPVQLIKTSAPAVTRTGQPRNNWFDKISEFFSTGFTDIDITEYVPENLGWLLIVLVTVVQLLAAAAAMRAYLSMSHPDIRLRQTLWFQVKLMLFGSLLGLAGMLILPFVWGALFGEIVEENQMMFMVLAGSLFMFLYTIVYYVLAKRDFDVEFVSAVIMAMLIGLVYFLVEVTFVKLGMEYENPLMRTLQYLLPE